MILEDVREFGWIKNYVGSEPAAPARVAGHSLAGAAGSDPGKLLHLLTRIPGRRPILKLLLLGGVILIAGIPGLTWAAKPAVDVEYSRPYVERDSGPLSADVYMPHDGAGPFPGMLVVHGGAWRMGSRADLAAIARALAEHGYVAVAIDYRLAPHDKFPAQINDCQAAVRWMRSHASEFKIDPDRMGGFGYSAGGHLAALLGTLGDNDLREKGVPKGAPSARLQVVLAGGAGAISA